MTPSTSLSAIDAVTSVIGPFARNGRRSSSATASAAAPAGLCAPSSRTSWSRDAQEFEPPRPDRIRIAPPPRLVGDRRDPGRLEGIERRIGDRHVRRLVAPAQADAGPPEPRQLDLDPIAVPAQQRRGRDLGQRHADAQRATPDDRQAVAACAGDGEVAALDDRGLLAGDLGDRVAQAVHVVEVDVRHDRHAAVPGMGRVESPAQADLDQRQVGTDLGEAGEDDGRQQLELGRLAVTRRDPVGGGQDALDQPREVVRGDRPAIDLDPLAVGHQVRLWGRPDPVASGSQRGIGEGQDAALAIGPGDQRATDRALGMVEFAEQGAGPPEAQPDPEATAFGQGTQCVVVGEAGRSRRIGHRSPVTRGTARPRRRRTG